MSFLEAKCSLWLPSHPKSPAWEHASCWVLGLKGCRLGRGVQIRAMGLAGCTLLCSAQQQLSRAVSRF